MGLHSAVAAFEAVCPEGGAGGKLKFGEDEVDEGEGDFVEDFPAVVGTLAAIFKQCNGILRLQPDIQLVTAAQAQIDAAVGIPFEVEIAVAAGVRAEEEFHTAVKAHHGHGAAFLRTDMLLHDTLVHVDGGIVIAQLLGHAYVCVRQPQNAVDSQGGDIAPVGCAGNALDPIFFHSGNLLLFFYIISAEPWEVNCEPDLRQNKKRGKKPLFLFGVIPLGLGRRRCITAFA